MCLASVSLIVLMAVISSDSVFDVNGAVSPEGFEYSVDGSGYVTITGYTGANEVVIPDTIDGRSVRYIGESAFENKTAITSITIPDSVTTIYGSAFEGCTALTKKQCQLLGQLCIRGMHIPDEDLSAEQGERARVRSIHGLLRSANDKIHGQCAGQCR